MTHARTLLVACGSAVLLGACGGGELDAGSLPVVAGNAGATSSAGGTSSAAGEGGTSSGTGGVSAAGGPGAAGESGAAGADPGPAFIAFSDSFKDFMSWPSFYLGDVPPTTNEMAGPRTIYINALPPHGAKEFPVGTVIVKAIQIGEPKTWQIFAMAKRGGGFNDMGALGWEWFELSLEFDALNVLWRGVAPPNGMGYGGGIGGGICNTCHAGAQTNDFVQDENLQLSSF